MFNVYKFEETVKEEGKTELSKAIRFHDRKISKAQIMIRVEMRDEMSKKYKDRVADFIKQVSIE